MFTLILISRDTQLPEIYISLLERILDFPFWSDAECRKWLNTLLSPFFSHKETKYLCSMLLLFTHTHTLCHVRHNDETKAQRDKKTFFYNKQRTLKQTQRCTKPSADMQIHTDNNPQNQNGKWQPKWDPQSETMINSCL
jgi:hypothetical protein